MAKPTVGTDWHRIDNNANLFVAVSGKRLSNVFRLSATLREDIDPAVLQEALIETLPKFKAFAVRLKKGLFWNYFESNHALPKIEEEKHFPCRTMDPHQNNLFLFRVSYFEKRINLEVFHALTDGTGGSNFLLALCYKYIMLKHHEDFTKEEESKLLGLSYSTNTEDSYVKNYQPAKKETYDSQKAHMLKGEIFPLDAVGILQANLKVDQLKVITKKLNCSITQYLCGCLQWGIYKETKKSSLKYPINIFMPVNLRPYYGSTTSLNFISGITVSIDYRNKDYTFEEIIEEVKAQFQQKLTKEAMDSKLAYTVGEGYSIPIRIVPFFLKKIVLQVLYKRSKRSNTMTLSNMGDITVLPRFKEYFDRFIVLLSATERECLKCSVISFNNQMAFSLSSSFKSCDIQKSIIRRMTTDGLDIVLESNGVYDEIL